MPKINIQFNKFLDPVFRTYHANDPKLKDWVAPDTEKVKEIAKNYQEIWDKEGDKILRKMQEYFGVSFKREIYDVHVVAIARRAFNNPFVISSHYSEQEFLETLTHELIHTLMKENKVPFEKIDAPPTVLTHIPVYKGLLHIFGKIKKPTNPDYLEAYTIATHKGA